MLLQKSTHRQFIYTLFIATENLLLELTNQSVRECVSTVLIKPNNNVRSQGNGELSIIIVTRKDIDGMAGTSTESLNRTIADFMVRKNNPKAH
jgi:hypothetical protein